MIAHGSRLSAVRLARSHAAWDGLGFDPFAADALDEHLAWLAGAQARIEDRLLAPRQQPQPASLVLYAGTSRYVEGPSNALAALGDKRAGTQGKRQLGIGLLCDEDGSPVSRAVFPGHTHEPRPVAAQVAKLQGRFGVTASTCVGDRGLLKGQQVEALAPHGCHYITALTTAQIAKLRRIGTLQRNLFDQEWAERLTAEGLRDVRRRHPRRAHDVRDPRQAQLGTLQAHVAQQNPSLTDQPRAHAPGALQQRGARAAKRRLVAWGARTWEGRVLTWTVTASVQPAAAPRDGGSGRQTDLPPAQAPQARGHDRSQALASVAPALRPCHTAPRAGRPLCLRREARTRAQAFVGRLAYQMSRSLAACGRAFDITVADGRQALTTRCLVDGAPQHAPRSHGLPTPRDTITRVRPSAAITLPTVFALAGVRVAPRKQRQSERLPQ